MAQYDKIARDYSGKDRTDHPQRKYVIYPSWLKACGNIENMLILDLGCGSGHSSRLLAEKKATVFAIDESDEQIRLAEVEQWKHPLSIIYMKACANKLPADFAHRFNLVTAAYLFHYAKSEDELYKFFQESYRALQSFGKLVAINMSPVCPVTEFLPGVSSSKEKWLDKPFHNGSRVEITLIGATGSEICSFTTYHWNREVYEKCLQESGFTNINWLNLEMATEGKAIFDNWRDLEKYHPLTILTAQKI